MYHDNVLKTNSQIGYFCKYFETKNKFVSIVVFHNLLICRKKE